MRSLLKHMSLLFVPAAGITYYLYQYKPRHYTLPKLVGNLVVNVTLWMLLLLPAYLIVYGMTQLIRKKHMERAGNQVKQC